MSGYPLISVSRLRRREEESAAARLGTATRERAEAETQEAKRERTLAAAGVRLKAACDDLAAGADQGGGGVAAATGAATAELARFVARRRSELQAAKADLLGFRSGPLSAVRAAEETARKEHMAARQAREVIDKHEAKFRAAERRAADRREEESLEDLARSAHHARHHGP